MTIYSTSFLRASVPAGTASAVVTVPAGHVYIVKAVTSWQAYATGAYATLRDASINGIVVALYPTSSSNYSSYYGGIVFEAGATFDAYPYVNAAVISVSGFDLSVP